MKRNVVSCIGRELSCKMCPENHKGKSIYNR